MEKDRFEDEGPIRVGARGAIHRVFDREIRRHVAVKTMHDSADPELTARFFEEAQIMGQLDHPNIVPVHDVLRDGRERPTRFIMTLVDGRTLDEILDEQTEAPVAGERLETTVDCHVGSYM